MTTETQLPQGWKKTTLGEIAIIKMGQSPDSKSYNKQNEGYQLIGGASDLGDKFPEPKQFTSEATKLSKINDIIICIRATIGRLNLSNKIYCLGRGVAGIEAHDKIETKFLWYVLMNSEAYLLKNSTGTTFQQVSSPTLKKLPIVYPTNKETQTAIVNKIESLFAEIDAGIGSLKTAQQQLKHYRQSLLKNAFNGELTKQWRLENADRLPSANELLAQIQTAREQHHAQQLADWQTAVQQWEQAGKQGKKPSKPKAPTQAVKFEENFADLPNGWLKTKFGNTTEVFIGSTPSRKNNEYWNGDIFWVSSGEVKFSNIVDTKEKITSLGLNNSSTTIHPIGTVMLAMIGEGKTRGQVGILKIEACHNQNTAAIRVNKEYLLSEYLYYFLMFNYEQTRRIGSGNNQKALNKSVIENMFFPLCSLAEQTQIVAILENKLTACDQLATELETQLKQAELLKQAVLKSAFSGSLLDK